MWDFLKRKPESYAFEDMRGDKELILTKDQYTLFLERLNWGLKRKTEDCAFVTVQKHNETATIEELYDIPYRFKSGSIPLESFYSLEDCFRLINKVTTKKQKIGFILHTHPRICACPSTHEEYSSALRTKEDDRALFCDSLEEPEKQKISVAERKIGDLIVEMLKGNNVCIQGYTPLSKSYYVSGSLHPELMEVFPLKTTVPELGLIFESYFHGHI